MWGLFKDEKADDQIADRLNEITEAMADRKFLVRLLGISAVLNGLVWISVLAFPGEVREGFLTVHEINDKLSKVTMAIVFGLGAWLAYSLFRLKLPDIEEQRLDREVMGTFAYQSHSNKRWVVWLLSVIAGVVNLLLLVVVDIALAE